MTSPRSGTKMMEMWEKVPEQIFFQTLCSQFSACLAKLSTDQDCRNCLAHTHRRKKTKQNQTKKQKPQTLSKPTTRKTPTKILSNRDVSLKHYRNHFLHLPIPSAIDGIETHLKKQQLCTALRLWKMLSRRKVSFHRQSFPAEQISVLLIPIVTVWHGERQEGVLCWVLIAESLALFGGSLCSE